MSPISLKSCLVLICTVLFSTSYSQENDEGAISTLLKPNVLYVSLGFIAFNGNYERMIRRPKEHGYSYWAKASFGYWSEPLGRQGRNISVGLTALSSSQKNGHLELSLGLTSLYDKAGYENSSNPYYAGTQFSKSDYRFLRPAGAIGYRVQKQSHDLIFRTGIGYPEILYMSFGFCFP